VHDSLLYTSIPEATTAAEAARPNSFGNVAIRRLLQRRDHIAELKGHQSSRVRSVAVEAVSRQVLQQAATTEHEAEEVAASSETASLVPLRDGDCWRSTILAKSPACVRR
jgi:hypothetical protein